MKTTHKIITSLVSISIAVLFSGTALAAETSQDTAQYAKQASFQAYKQKQNQRIKQGIRSGQLTVGETKRLVKQQRDIRRDARSFNADGKITKAERRHLRRDTKRSSKAIYRAKHNNKTRPHTLPN